MTPHQSVMQSKQVVYVRTNARSCAAWTTTTMRACPLPNVAPLIRFPVAFRGQWHWHLRTCFLRSRGCCSSLMSVTPSGIKRFGLFSRRNRPAGCLARNPVGRQQKLYTTENTWCKGFTSRLHNAVMSSGCIILGLSDLISVIIPFNYRKTYI